METFKRTINFTATHYMKPEETYKFDKIIQDFYINEAVAKNESKV